MLEDADGETAMTVAERIREAVENALFVPGGKKVPLRTSAGVASFPELHVKRAGDLVFRLEFAYSTVPTRNRSAWIPSSGSNSPSCLSNSPFWMVNSCSSVELATIISNLPRRSEPTRV